MEICPPQFLSRPIRSKAVRSLNLAATPFRLIVNSADVDIGEPPGVL